MPMRATAEYIPSQEEQIYKASKKDANGVGWTARISWQGLSDNNG